MLFGLGGEMVEPQKICRICKVKEEYLEFEEWGELASHILTAHAKAPKNKLNKASLKWAANYKFKNALLKKQEQYRIPLTKGQKEAKTDTRRILSGKTILVETFCPKCRETHREDLDKEYVESPHAVKVGSKFEKLCRFCATR